MTTSDHFIPEEVALSVLFSSKHVANPFPVFAQLRSLGAIVPFTIPLGGTMSQAWMVTRMEEAVRIFKDHAHFTVDPRSLGGADAALQRTADSSDDVPPFYMPGSSMVSVDEPDHRRLRRLVSAAFTPRYIEKAIKKGDVLVVALSSANHDEAAFSHPDELDIERTLSRHIAFGQGIHICLGAPLARLEGEIALTTLLKRLPNLQLAVPRESVTWRISSNLRGLISLPVAF
jgi:cytochrome P450